MPRVPRVATNGGMRNPATRYPLARPNTVPTATAASNPSGIDPVATETSATTMEVSVSTAPIERSSPSVMITSVIGNESNNSNVDCTNTLAMLAGEAKPGAAAAKVTTGLPSTIATPGNRRRGWEAIAETASAMMHPQSHDIFLGELGSREFAGNAP